MKRAAAFGLILALIAALGAASIASFRPILVFNPTASAPAGLYLIGRAQGVKRDDVVAAWAPDDARALAADRGYLPFDLPLVKRAWAVGGERVCARDGVIEVADRPRLAALHYDSNRRPLAAWEGCRVLAEGEVFLGSDRVLHAFDSRYFGPVSQDQIIGRAHLIWSRAPEAP